MDGLQRKSGSGRPRLLSALDQTALLDIALQPATDFEFETDLCTIGRLHRVIHELYDRTISADTIWRRVRDAGLTYQKPERQYFQLDEKAREQWMRTEASAIRKSVKKFNALLYFQDEANVSLTAFLGKTLAPVAELLVRKLPVNEAVLQRCLSSWHDREKLLLQRIDRILSDRQDGCSVAHIVQGSLVRRIAAAPR